MIFRRQKQFIQTRLVERLNSNSVYEGVVLSDSMSPLIEIGDFVKVIKKPFINLCVGAIVAYKQNRKIHLHRVKAINKDKNLILTSGDNLDVNDIPLRKQSYMGQAIELQTPNGIKVNLSGKIQGLFGIKTYLYFPRKYNIRKLVKAVEYFIKIILRKVIMFYSKITKK